jgi:hypothetical protein
MAILQRLPLVVTVTSCCLAASVAGSSGLTSRALTQSGQFTLGWWRNVDERTAGITRAHFRMDSGALWLHLWGACTPECDNGEREINPAGVTADAVSLAWASLARGTGVQFAVRPMRFSLLPTGHLAVTEHVHFTDNSRRRDQDHAFELATCHEPCVWPPSSGP